MLRIVPSADYKKEVQADHKVSVLSVPKLNVSAINNAHPLESRLANWDKTQYDSRLEIYRRTFGAGEPIKREMELSIVGNELPSSLSTMHSDILLGNDATVDWSDVYVDNSPFDIRNEIERGM